MDEVDRGTEQPQTKRPGDSLAQFYISEYSVMMGRVSGWAPLQYATWPILIAALTLVARLDNFPLNLRWWIALGVSLVVFLAYQNTGANALYYVLLIEQYLRPRARGLVNTDEFWIHERVFHQIYKQGVAWSPIWPPVICTTALILITGFLLASFGFHRVDVLCALVALGMCGMVAQVTLKVAKLKRDIATVCKKSGLIAKGI